MSSKLWINPLAALLAARPGTIRGLYTSDQMRSVLNRERSRSDRTGLIFSLVIYTLAGRDRDARLRALVRILRRRLRTTDEVGWLNDDHLAVVLLDAPHEGACKVAGDVAAAWPRGWPRLNCEVCTYPSNDATGVEGEREETALQGEASGGPPAPALEILFARPLPVWKRAVDIAGAVAALALFSPLLAVAAIAVKLSSPGPWIFAQRRAGLGGRTFTMYKVRTMVADAEAKKSQFHGENEQDGPAFKLTSDPRVTRVGRFLRKTSIDELPQLWNVLRGEMSLVGPRPLPVDESDQCRGWHRRRLEVTPGLTCIWQVRGRSQVTFGEWMKMDLTYVHSRSLWHDLKLIALTIPAVLSRRGAR